MQRRYNNALLVATLAVAILQLWVVIGQIGPPWLQPLLLILLIALGSLWVWSGMRMPRTFPQSVAPDRSAVSPLLEDEKMYLWLVRRYGLGYDLMDVECEIKEDGVEVRRRLLARAHAGVRQIDNTLFLKPDQRSPEAVLRPPRITSLDPNRELYIETPKESPGIVVVTISPPLRESESTEFVLREEIKGQFFATTISRSELQRRTKEDDQDFFAWRIDRPTRKLSLKVTFPEDTRPMSYSHRVFFAPVAQGLPNREQHEELRRIKAPVLGASPRGLPQLVLDVDHPAVGLLYAIYWNPPVDESIP